MMGKARGKVSVCQDQCINKYFGVGFSNPNGRYADQTSRFVIIAQHSN